MGRGSAGGPCVCGGAERLGGFAAEAGKVDVVFGDGAFIGLKAPFDMVGFGFDG